MWDTVALPLPDEDEDVDAVNALLLLVVLRRAALAFMALRASVLLAYRGISASGCCVLSVGSVFAARTCVCACVLGITSCLLCAPRLLVLLLVLLLLVICIRLSAPVALDGVALSCDCIVDTDAVVGVVAGVDDAALLIAVTLTKCT